MYLYNVTVNIDESVQEEWLKWMKEVHIPEMLATGKFKKAMISKVMINEEMGGITYAVQYTAESKEILDKYYLEDADRLRADVQKLFAGKFVVFRTELDIVEEFHKED